MFDTLKFARHLETSGLSAQVAAGVAGALNDALTGSNLATKDDLRDGITGLRHEMELPRRDITIKFGGMIVIAVGVLLAAIRYLPPHP